MVADVLPPLAHDMIDAIRFRRAFLPSKKPLVMRPDTRCGRCGMLLVYIAEINACVARCSTSSCGDVARVELGVKT